MANRFKISGLSNLDTVSLCSDYMIVETNGVAKKTTLKSISENTTFDNLHTRMITINNIPLKGFIFKGIGEWISDTKIKDVQTGQTITANNSNIGWIYQGKQSNKQKVWISNGEIWVDCGLEIVAASKTDYGVVKIGEGLDVNQGVLCADFNKIPTKQDFIGQNCDIAYTTPNGLVKQSILTQNLYVCENDQEIEQAKTSNIQFKNILDTWQKCGHYSDRWYGYTQYPPPSDPTGKAFNDYGYPYWYYDDSVSSIVQPKNTIDDSFYVSKTRYQNYDITIRCYSDNFDDDINGFIIAFVDDGNKPSYLAACRSPNSTSTTTPQPQYHWYVVKNNAWITEGVVRNNSVVSCNNPSEESSALSGWDKLGTGTLIRVKREENMISAWTTPFVRDGTKETATNIDRLSYPIILDLSKIFDGEFNKPASIGYITNSQAQSKYENINIELEKTVVDTRDNSLSTYNPITKQWKLESTGFNTLSSCGFGRMMKNQLTQKVFYVGQNSFSRVNNADINIDTKTFTQKDDYLPSSKLVYTNLVSISSMIQTQLTRLNGIV